MADYNDNSGDKAADATSTPLEIPAERKALVKKWVKTVKADKKHWEKDFQRMEVCVQLAAEGAAKEWVDAEKYVVPITNRHINQAVATLYARNPKAVAKRKSKLLYQIWDEDPQSLQAAMMAVQPPVDPVTGAPLVDPVTMMPPAPDPNAVALIEEVMAAKQQLLMYDRLGRTMELLFDYFLGEQDLGYREEIKAVVRRAKVTCVGYIKLGFQRQLKPDPDVSAGIADVTSKIARIETLMASGEGKMLEPESANIEELRLLLADLQAQPELIVREGPVLSFPASNEIIPDKKTRHLKTFAGAGHVTQEFHMTPERVFEVYGVDIKKGGFDAYKRDDKKGDETNDTTEACIWEVQDKDNGQTFTICDGYPDFLKEPAEPDVKIERFWTLFPLVFNEAEGRVFPISDVWAVRHMQREYNNAREGLRNHRIANQPKYPVRQGMLSEIDKQKLGSAASHEIIEINTADPSVEPSKVLKPMEHAAIDPALYETESMFQDVQRTVGAQEANLGGTSGATATETSIAENSRMSASADNIDDLDTMLSQLAKAMGQLMLLELDIQTVQEIAGPGAVWPQVQPRREEIAKDLLLEIEAGSSGRPNKAAELANLERAMPSIVQIPGFNPVPLGKKYARLLDLDVTDAYVEGLPSIVAMNQMTKPVMGAGADPQKNPNNQGGEGGNNAPKPAGNEPQSQPAFPAPSSGMAPQAASI